jgi:hypothetical protein
MEDLFEEKANTVVEDDRRVAGAPNQAIKNRIAANRARAQKKRQLKRKEVEEAKPKWEIRQEAILFEDPEAKEDKVERGHRDAKEDAAVKEQLRLLEVRLKAERDAEPKSRESSGAASSWERQQTDGQSADDEHSNTADREKSEEEATKSKTLYDDRNQVSLGGGGLRDIWAEMCTAEADEAERIAAEEEAQVEKAAVAAEKEAAEEAERRGRQAECDAFEEELARRKGGVNSKKDCGAESASKGEATAQAVTRDPTTGTSSASTGVQVHLEAVQDSENLHATEEGGRDPETVRDLLELCESGNRVTWPAGLDPTAARKLLQRLAAKSKVQLTKGPH